MPEPFHGVLPALITPFTADGRTIDTGALAANVERLIGAGVGGLVPGGSTGEFTTLSHGERRELMHGHGKVGRRYTGRVLQLVTGSTGLDDFEWGVTLLADDLSAIKEVVYDMRFDEVTAAYGRFGPFLVGLTCDPAELPERLGLG